MGRVLDRRPEPETTADRREVPSWWLALASSAWVAWGVAGAVLLAVDGSAPWRVLRAGLALALAAGGLALTRHRSRWWPFAAVLAGSLALATGGVVGGRDLAAGGWPLRAAAALLLAAAGLGLVVAGSADAVARVRPGWRRVAVVPAIVLAVALVAFVVGPPVAATNVPRVADGPRTPADLGIAAEEVRLPTADGVELAAWWVPSPNGAAVVLRHGAGSTRDDVLAQLAVLARAGFGVLATDARGHGDSGGRAMDFGWYGDLDVDAALTWLSRRPGVDADRLGLVGLSMGGEEAVGMAADPRVRAVVAEGVTGRSDADKGWLEAYGVRGRVQQGIEWLQTRVTDLLTAASPPRPLDDAVAASDIPVLLVTADLVDEERAATRLQRVAPDRVDVWVVDGAAHTGGLPAQPDEWEARVVGFLAAATGPAA